MLKFILLMFQWQHDYDEYSKVLKNLETGGSMESYAKKQNGILIKKKRLNRTEPQQDSKVNSQIYKSKSSKGNRQNR